MKIGFTGTMSVGKTTLVNALKEHPDLKDYKFATERSKYLRDLGIPLNTDSTLKGQTIFLAERCSELLNENIITDRTVLDVIAFTNLASSITVKDGDDFEKYAKKFLKEYDLIFYVSPEGVPLENNGVRTIDPYYREKVDTQIRKLMNKHYNDFRYPPIFLTGSLEERLHKIQQVVFP